MPHDATTDQDVGAAAAIVAALGMPQARIAPAYFYDQRGSALFERITRLPEYYPTRTENAIMAMHGRDIGSHIAAKAAVIELGAGNCEKAHRLCALIRPRCYVAVDISGAFLQASVAGLRRAFPALDVRTVVADINGEIRLPAAVPSQPRLAYYPGSSIGNFDPQPAVALLSRIRCLLGEAGALLVGVDLVKEEAVLDAAYNDAAGITAAFNLNVLDHLNCLIGADFDRREWRHRAFFNRAQSRIEMHLEAATNLHVTWAGGGRDFRCGERIHTESSYKYRREDFAQLLAQAGFRQQACWTDPRRWFAVFLATV